MVSFFCVVVVHHWDKVILYYLLESDTKKGINTVRGSYGGYVFDLSSYKTIL